ncbi:iron-sulfur cluster biosynthesis [Bacillus sp. FJAT-18017]|uniref:hypothetical protein n=1 Tax=Bacillus sp. FJAT-18017 TaxID=1705566 RepID=UPI0006AEC661|nr:hypothetical protein [Bacillus sp. FJAT-18017]ALC92227.1 iron-sulfur cluster biosynthesis [Bacillus sp. FJAT-18017]
MFKVTEATLNELNERIRTSTVGKLIRLQMRKSCFMKVKITLEATAGTNDEQVAIDGLEFIIDKGERHYFRNKTLDFIPDQTGFKQFEIL